MGGSPPRHGEARRGDRRHGEKYRPRFSLQWRLIPDAEFRPIQTIDGQLALPGADTAAIGQIDKHLGDLLAVEI
jgi:hypothetical protein